MNKTITFELNKESLQELVSYIKNINDEDKDKYIIEVKRKKRSYKQLKYYFGAVLPAILYFLKDDININDTETLHIYLKEFYSFQTKQEYFKPVIINNKKRYINTFSIDFDNCNMKEFNLYLSFIENNLGLIINPNVDVNNFDDLVDMYSIIDNTASK